jgi:glutamate racemase
MAPPHVLVYDSGLGGLSVARALRELAGSHLHLSYLADTAGFPYGDWQEEALRRRILDLMARAIDAISPDVVVIACNTATVTALSHLRARFDMPFVGTVPAIKPAANATKSGIIGVLATPSTVRREYTEMLIHTFAYHHRVVLHGARGLARLAERHLSGETVEPAAIAAEIAPAFVKNDDGRRTDVLVLGCTHYPLIRKEIEKTAPWPVTIIDPSPAIARRALEVAQVCGENAGSGGSDGKLPAGPVAWVTDETGLSRLSRPLRRAGFAALCCLSTPCHSR